MNMGVFSGMICNEKYELRETSSYYRPNHLRLTSFKGKYVSTSTTYTSK